MVDRLIWGCASDPYVLEGRNLSGELVVRYTSYPIDVEGLPTDVQSTILWFTDDQPFSLIENQLTIQTDFQNAGIGTALWKLLELMGVRTNPEAIRLLMDKSETGWTTAMWPIIQQYLLENGYEVIIIWDGWIEGIPTWIWYASPVP